MPTKKKVKRLSADTPKDKHVYNPGVIEPKWQEIWDKEKVFSPDLAKAKDPYYNLMMFPYPSAEGLHIGNMYAFTGADIWGRFQRMQGRDVFQPIGLDGFGIHSENYAIKIGAHPKTQSEVTKKRFYEQLHSLGNGYDWKHTLETFDPDYYRWTQWLFVQMFKAGLAYRKKAEVNWCPSCKTVLADEQVISGQCERCKSIVESRNLEQWFFKITDYAERLLSNLEKIDWSEKVKIAQKNWIGKSTGAEIKFKVVGPVENSSRSMSSLEAAGTQQDALHSRHPQDFIHVFTTRPDTLYGVTFMVLAPDSEWVEKITTKEQKEDVSKYIESNKSITFDPNNKDKTGVFTGGFVLNPATNEEIPVYVSNYVLSGYGSGAVMGVPAHDQRDFEFAKKYDIEIRTVIQAEGDNVIARSKTTKQSIQMDRHARSTTLRARDDESAYVGDGVLIDSGDWTGMEMPLKMDDVIKSVEKAGWGVRKVTYHLRDWLISRQRYWGPPIPMIYCEKCDRDGKGDREDMGGWYYVREEDLPVELPYVENYRPTGSGESPLAQDPSFVKVKCPNCGSKARRETDVSDTFLDSAWYFLRYLATDIDWAPFPSKKFVDSVDQIAQQVSKSDSSASQNISNSVNQNSRNTDKLTNRRAELSDKPNFSELAERARWLPVLMYIGGAEHSVLHLLYARFMTMALNDWALIDFEEPFTRFYAHGMIIKDGAKMSKSKGNVVVPDEYIRKFGADTVRTYLMFLGPFNQGGDFRDSGIEGMSRFLNRVWRLVQKNDKLQITNAKLREEKLRHIAIKRVTDDLNDLRYNRALAGIMEYVNALEERSTQYTGNSTQEKNGSVSPESIKTLLLLLAPFAPHMTEELWEKLQVPGASSQVPGKLEPGTRNLKTGTRNPEPGTWSIHHQPWPTYDPKILVEDEIKIPVQVNGKLRGVIEIDKDKDKETVEQKAREAVAKYLTSTPKKVIYVPGKLINFVV